ncbi:MAG: S8 family serine peptidase [Phycisphaerae bacterium]|nr:S8 family serine peptidase [Phycisphaerae bacterium]
MFARRGITQAIAPVLFLISGVAAGNAAEIDPNWGPGELNYEPHEIIVKFKKAVADSLEEQLAEGVPINELRLTDSLDRLNLKHEVWNAAPVIKNFRARREQMRALLEKDEALLTNQEAHLVRRLKRAPKGTEAPDLGRIYMIYLEAGQSAPYAAAEYERDADVEYAELNHILTINSTEPNDPCYPVQWALANSGQYYPDYVESTPNYPPGTANCDIDANEAWDITTGSSDIIVAVVDTGVDYSHRDLAGNMWVNQAEFDGEPNVDDDGNRFYDDIYGYDFCTLWGETEDGDPNDDNGHGTHCAGTIAAEGNNGVDIAGVCWEARIMALKVADSDGKLDIKDAIRCINYAVLMRADVISNSWGGWTYNEALKDGIDDAYSQGVLLVAGAGNNAVTLPFYPAYYDNVIAVGATDSDDVKAGFSNYGMWLDVGAPGVDILSLGAAELHWELHRVTT